MGLGTRFALAAALVTGARVVAGGSAQEACAAEPKADEAGTIMQQALALGSTSLSETGLEGGLRSWAGLGADADLSIHHIEPLVASLAEKVASQNYTMNAVEIQALQTIRSMTADILNHMAIQHAEDQFEVNEAADMVANCARTANGNMATVNAYNERAGQSRDNHSECRVVQKGLYGAFDDLRQAYDYARKTPPLSTPPSCMFQHMTEAYVTSDDPTMKRHFEGCMDDVNDWFPALYDHYSAYKLALEALRSKAADCDKAQGTFEQSFCTYAQELDLTCDTQTSCRADTMASRQDTEEHVHGDEAIRKAMYESGTRVLCFLRVFDTNGPSKQTILGECMNLVVDTSHLDIVYPGDVAAAGCTKGAHRPCDEAWKTAEYISKSWHGVAGTTDCHACVAR